MGWPQFWRLPVSPEQAMARWRAGHRAFFVLLQGILLAHRHLSSALAAGDQQGARRAFNLASRLLDGSAAAMEFSGDMPAESYLVVRESMTPPYVPERFSGLWSADHRAMMNDLKVLRSQLTGLDKSLETDRQAWQEALDRTYLAHAHVCENFVGDGPSLAMTSQQGECTRSALESIEAFRVRAMSLVSPPQRDPAPPEKQ
jgi:hypothetical protein